ncbi:MAG: peptidoglycan-binding domain-containing protein [Rhodobacteraceae bacterium]|nr:peptidoglycan-binding domain-containing protein [Paracoccaceae bacterium]
MKETMRRLLLPLLAIFIATMAYAGTGDELQLELDAVNQQIAEARDVAETHEEPAVRLLAEERLATLLLTQAILKNRIAALGADGVSEVQIAVTKPDMAEVATIAAEMAITEAAIEEAEEAVRTSTGAEKAIAEARLESEKIALAQLRVAYVRARYGVAPVTSGTGDGRRAASASDWADRRYPEIDYSHQLFEMAYESGARISGWWTIAGRRGSATVFAQNLSAYDPDAVLKDRGMLLQVSCRDNQLEVTVSQPGRYLVGYDDGSGAGLFDVNYRIDAGALGREEWYGSTSGNGASIDGNAALTFIDELRWARHLEVELIDGPENRHRAEFTLAGFDDVSDAVDLACSQTVITLNQSDYKLIQTLLNIAGHNAGKADGIWGPQSSRAIGQYQRSAGLPETGVPDRATLDLLGLLP